MNGPRIPREETTAEPDPDDVIVRWEVTGCRWCKKVIVRPVRTGNVTDWRHTNGYEDCRAGWRS